jgi:membrane protein YdbS with pleckstrin-like domain
MNDAQQAPVTDALGDPIRYPIVYTGSTVSKMASWVLGLAFAAGGLFFLQLQWRRHLDIATLLFSAVMVVLMLLVAVFCVASAMRGRLTLEAQAIEVRTGFGTRRLQRADLLGRRVVRSRNGTYPYLVPKSGRGLRVERSTFGLDSRFDAWFDSLPDLDAQERADTLAMVERDPSLGVDAKQRLATLDKANQLAKVLNLLPVALLFWGFIYPRPYALVIACAALLPWLAVVLVWSKPGVFRFDGKNGDVRPNLAQLLIMPPMLLAARAVIDITLVDLGPLFLWGAMLGLPLCAAILAAPKTAAAPGTKLWALPLVVLPFMLIYGASLLALTDTMWDDAKPQVIQTTITGKDIHHGKSTTYYLELAPWSQTIDKDRIAVSRSYFDVVDRGDPVCVRLHPGKFGLRWMQVGGCG